MNLATFLPIKFCRHRFIERERKRLICRDHRLHGVFHVHAQPFGMVKKNSGAKERDDDSGAAQREQKFSSLAVHEHEAADGHEEIDQHGKSAGKMSVQIGKAGLDQNRRIVTDDGIDAGELVAREDDTGQKKRDDVFAMQQRFADFFTGQKSLPFRRPPFPSFPPIRLPPARPCANAKARRARRQFSRVETASAAIRQP